MCLGDGRREKEAFSGLYSSSAKITAFAFFFFKKRFDLSVGTFLNNVLFFLFINPKISFKKKSWAFYPYGTCGLTLLACGA